MRVERYHNCGAMAPMLLTAVESIAEGATKEQVEAAWAHVSSCMAKVPGFTRQQASWSTDGKAFITEVFETPADYLAFMGLVDLPLVTKACLLYTSPSPRDGLLSRMPSSA